MERTSDMDTGTRSFCHVAAVASALAGPALAGVTPVRLRCEYATNPLGIDTARPRLSWVLESSERNQVQTAYQILVAGTPENLAADRGDLWDSGKVSTSQTLHVVYSGRPLSSGQRAYWKIRAWDGQGRDCPWSRPAWWEMALLKPDDWKATWITSSDPAPAKEEAMYADRPAPLFRREFTVSKEVKRARAYVSGLGYYELHINGEKVGDQVLDPGWTTYSRRVHYSTYDVTDRLKPGKAAVGIMVGNGWYNPLPLRMWGRFNLREALTIGRPRTLLQLYVEYADGTSDTLVTDPAWKVGDGPILRNSVYLGEVYDARREQEGWDKPGFDDTAWRTAVAATEPIGPLRAQTAPPIRCTRTLKPVRLTEPKPGTVIVDMGQNFAGWVTLRTSGPAGTRIQLRYGELLYPDGTLNPMTSVAGQVKSAGVGGPGAPPYAWQGEAWFLKGEGTETYTPRFTFHGFRYVEVTGWIVKPTPDAIEGRRLNSDVQEAGAFSCSNELFNRIQDVVRWTLLSNLFSVQSDCPHREKFGYGGDILASSEMAILNYDMERFYAKVVRDHADAARPDGAMTETAPFVGIADEGLSPQAGPIGWGTAHPLLQWQLYQYYGDRGLLEEQYEQTKAWVEFLRSHAVDLIVDKGISDHESLVAKPVALTGTAFFHYNALLMSRIAGVLGRTSDAERYGALARDIQDAFNRRFLKPGTGRYDSGTQACQAFALYFDLVPPAERRAALDVLVNDVMTTHKGHLSTGIFGTKYMLNALSDAGRADVATTIAGQKTFPGWGHMLEGGATTLWEHWEFSDNTFSHNHPMFGSVSEWFYRTLAGINIDPNAAGFDRMIIRPRVVSGLTWAKAHHDSIRGRIVSDWRLNGDTLTLAVTIPVNTKATVHVPAGDPPGVTEGDHPADRAAGVRFLRTEDGTAVYEVGSGEYRFVSRGAGKR
jgi:alpha-L-rhamnosidase